MTLNSNQNTSLSYLMRQLSVLVKKGHNIDDALDKLKSSIPNNYQTNLEAIRNIFSDQPDADKLRNSSGPISRLYKLVSITKRNGGDCQKLVGSFYETFLKVPGNVLFKAFDIGNVMFYVMALFIILFIMISVNAIFVLPEFQTLFMSFGAELPKLTKVVIFIADKLYWLIALIAGSAIFFAWYLVNRTKFNTRTQNYFTSVIYKIPVIDRIAKNYNRFLVMNYIAILMESGVNKDVAVNEIQTDISDFSVVSTNQTFMPRDDIATALTSSYQLDTFSDELQFQVQNTLDNSMKDFYKLKERLSLFSLITAAIVVGVVVIALYLPIFQLGNIVL